MEQNPSSQDASDPIDDSVPEQDAPPLKVVGIGASAGGFTALHNLFSHLPPDSGMTFIVILHLSPDYDSQAASVLQAATSMPVVQATSRVSVVPNQVYVIPPAKQITIVDDELHLQEPTTARHHRAPIDLFLRTLAETHRDRAIAIILSGAGNDGTMGAQRVKESEGAVFVQDPHEAEHAGMPESVIASGCVDFVLPVADIAEHLLVYWQKKEALQVSPPPELQTHSEDSLREVFALLRARTGHSFGQYKRPTVNRRVARRMQVHGVTDLPGYLSILRSDQEEAPALLRDLLISVTNFFRNPEAWQALENIIPLLFADKGPQDQIRVWVAGCATGEEAYSIAILLYEQALKYAQPPRIQIFATDIDEDAIAFARQALYNETIAVDIPLERLQRYFSREHGGYRVAKVIRDMILFASHNLLHDPPFSKLDLVTCRNVLIYLNHDAQEHVLRLFHFTLRPKGFLLLGTSESTDGLSSLFAHVDKAQRLYQRLSARDPSPIAIAPLSTQLHDVRLLPGHLPGPQETSGPYVPELDLRALAQYGPPTIIVNRDHEIIHVARGAGRFLQVTDGLLSANLLRLIHPGLRLEMRNVLFTAIRDGVRVDVPPLRISLDGTSQLVALSVQPLWNDTTTQGLLLIILNLLGTDAGEAALTLSDGEEQVPASVVQAISTELDRTKFQLQVAVEQYETSVEEHKAANEELQAINEELRAASEELETSKEELQSVNEELITVNAAMKQKVEEVIQTNNDLQNLITVTEITTIFVDRSIRIKWYTPSAERIFNLIPTDVNRPLSHMTHSLVYPTILADIQQVLRTLAPIEHEVQSTDDRWYLARLRPYRTREDRIDGVVLTFVDITERKRITAALQASEQRAKLVIESVQDYAIFTLTPDNRIDSWNVAAEKIMGYSEVEIIGQNGAILFTPEDRAKGAVEEELNAARTQGHVNDERWHLRKDGTRFYASGVASPLRDAAGTLRGYVKVMRDLTEAKKAQEALREAHAELEVRVQERTAELAAANTQLHTLLNALVTAQEDERKRIARELHDQLGQSLTALRLGLATLLPQVEDEATLHRSVRRLQEIAAQLDNDVDLLALELRPNVLDNLGLAEAVQQHVERWSERSSVAVDLHISMTEGTRLSPELETVVYRVIQEALTNILKHAQAKQASIILRQSKDDLRVIIEDDGQGFDPATSVSLAFDEPRLGLLGMHERIMAVGGTLTVESIPGQGTALYITIPLPAQ